MNSLLEISKKPKLLIMFVPEKEHLNKPMNPILARVHCWIVCKEDSITELRQQSFTEVAVCLRATQSVRDGGLG
jgi:hypothetical protein